MFRRKEEPTPPPASPGPVLTLAKPSTPLPATPEPAAEAGQRGAAPPVQLAPPPRPAPAAPKLLTVGPGISLAGEITACDRLLVEGTVKVTLNRTRAIEIAEAGRFTEGRAEVEEAEISGVYEGELTVRKRLLIRGTGRVRGTVRYGELEIERGGELSGTVSMLKDKTAG